MEQISILITYIGHFGHEIKLLFKIILPFFVISGSNTPNIFSVVFSKKRLTNKSTLDILVKQFADVAELADAHDSGSCELSLIGVQVPSSALLKNA